MAADRTQVIKHVFNKRVLRLISDGTLGFVHTADGLVDNLLVALSDFAADKQAKLSAAMAPTFQDDAADDRMDEEGLPSANADPVINGWEYTPPPSLLKHMPGLSCLSAYVLIEKEEECIPTYG
ncbi:TPA: hypothetical protein ACH3X1_003922 [Trebouxia sp. C0004]